MPQLRLKQLDGKIDAALDLQVIEWDNANEVWKAGRKNIRTAGVPDNTNDDSEGFSIGSIWVDTGTDNAYVCLDATTNAAVWLALSKTGEPYQEDVAGINIPGGSGDTVLTAPTYKPISKESFKLYLNGQLQRQGAGLDYTVTGANNNVITWLMTAGTKLGQEIPMDVNDFLTYSYETLDI